MALYAFDGTWQQAEEEAGHKNTNVSRFTDAYDGERRYYKGVGTRGGKVLRLIAGVTGLGGQLRIWEAEHDLTEQLAKGDDTIDIIGFSRGAALALDFANEIAERGRRDGLRVRFLGLFDTVHAFGVPGIDLNLIHDPELPDLVDHCVHALALDERRATFRPTRVLSAEEVWFRGAHSDIGGGNENPGLNAIALNWMMAKAMAAGLPLHDSALESVSALADADADIKPSKFDPIKDQFRRVLPDDKVHYTVGHRAGAHNNVHDTFARETVLSETLLRVADFA